MVTQGRKDKARLCFDLSRFGLYLWHPHRRFSFSISGYGKIRVPVILPVPETCIYVDIKMPFRFGRVAQR